MDGRTGHGTAGIGTGLDEGSFGLSLPVPLNQTIHPTLTDLEPCLKFPIVTKDVENTFLLEALLWIRILVLRLCRRGGGGGRLGGGFGGTMFPPTTDPGNDTITTGFLKSQILGGSLE